MKRRLALSGMALALIAGCTAPDTSDSAATAVPGPHALYVTNWASSTISALRLNDDGSIREPAGIERADSGSANPQASVRSYDGKRLYVADWGTGSVTAYTIAVDGVLTAPVTVPGAAPTPDTPSAIALSPDGKNLYTANFSNGADGTVSHFLVTTEGLPKAVSTIPAHGRGTTGLAIAPDGHTLLTANWKSDDVSSFAVAADGSLTWVMSLPTEGGAFFPAITPGSDFAVVTNSGADTVSLLGISRQARLSVVNSAPSNAREPRGVVLDRAGDRAYVANFNGGTSPGAISAFDIRPGGITALGPARPTGSNGAEGIALAPDGKTLYNANFNADGDGSVTSFPIQPDGTLGEARDPVLTGGRQPDLGSITTPIG